MSDRAEPKSSRREFEDTLAWYALLRAERDLYHEVASRLTSIGVRNFDDSILRSEASDIAEETYEVATAIVGEDIAAAEAELQKIEAQQTMTPPPDPNAERLINEDCMRIESEIADLKRKRANSQSKLARDIKVAELTLLKQEESHLLQQVEDTERLLNISIKTHENLSDASKQCEAKLAKRRAIADAVKFISSLLST